MERSQIKWTGEVHSEGELRFRLGRDGDRLFAEWLGICTLVADRHGAWSELVAAPGADPNRVDKLYRGLAKALLRDLEGGLTLHASAMAIDGVALGCAGESKMGKSTTVADMVRRHEGALVSDDTLAIVFHESHVGVLPTERVSWLRPDARAALDFGAEGIASKVAVDPPRVVDGEVPLRALVILGWDDDANAPRVRRLRGHAALEKLVPTVVRFILDDAERNRRELEQLLRLTSLVPFYELVRPKKLEVLGATCDALVALARNAEEGSR